MQQEYSHNDCIEATQSTNDIIKGIAEQVKTDVAQNT